MEAEEKDLKKQIESGADVPATVPPHSQDVPQDLPEATSSTLVASEQNQQPACLANPPKITVKTIGKWTEEQVRRALNMFPKLKNGLDEVTSRYTYAEFRFAMEANNINFNELSLQAAKREYRELLIGEQSTGLDMIFDNVQIKKEMTSIKNSIIAHHKIGDLGMLKMKLKCDTPIDGVLEVFIRFSLGTPLKERPLHLLAHLDDAMQKFFGENGRTDRLVLHFAPRFPEVDALKKLPEFRYMCYMLEHKEKDLENVASTSEGGASTSKATVNTVYDSSPSTSQQQLDVPLPIQGASRKRKAQNTQTD